MSDPQDITPNTSPKPAFPTWIAVLLGAMTAYIIWMQSYFWSTVEDYAFGYIVPMFVGFILYDRWGKIQEHFQAPANPCGSDSLRITDVSALSVFHGGLLLFSFGALLRIVEGPSARSALAATLGYVVCGLCLCYLLCMRDGTGRRRTFKDRIRFTSLFIFPLLIWLISSPLLPQVQTTLQVYLLNKVIWICSFIFELMGLNIYREGSILMFPGGSVGVEEACSGIRSLTACIFAGSFLCAVFMKTLPRKILLIVLAMLLAFGTNILRSLFLTLYAYNYGSDAIEGTVHDVAGYAVLGITSAGLLLVCATINKIEAFLEPPDPQTLKTAQAPTPKEKAD